MNGWKASGSSPPGDRLLAGCYRPNADLRSWLTQIAVVSSAGRQEFRGFRVVEMHVKSNCIFAFLLSATTATADVEIGCVSEQLLAEFSEMVSITDITESSATAQLIMQLPLRYSDLVLDFIHLRRFEEGKRTLWTGVSFQELNEGKSWSSVEIVRTDLTDYKFYAQYRSEIAGQKKCFYEFPIVWETSD